MNKKPDPAKTRRLSRAQIAADNEKQTADFFKMVEEAGWELYQPADWEQIEKRYRADRDIADAVPRELMFWDMAMLVMAVRSYKDRAERYANSLSRLMKGQKN